MADEGEVSGSEVRVVELDDDQPVETGVVVPKGEELPPPEAPAEPPPGQIVDVPPPPDGELRVLEPEPARPTEPAAPIDDGTSNTILLPEEPAPPGDGPVREPAPVAPIDDGTSNTILFPEEPAPQAPAEDGSSDTVLLPEEPPAHPEPTAPVPVAEVHEPPTAPTHDLPTDLFDAPPAFATGAAPEDAPGAAPVVAEAAADPVDLAPDGTPDTGAVVDEPPAPPEPLEVVAEEADEDDPSFLERVADAVGDLWDDATDAVT